MAPTWLDSILYRHATLDLVHPDARAQLATAILEGLPDDVMRRTTRATLVFESIRSATVTVTPDSLASEITRTITEALKEG